MNTKNIVIVDSDEDVYNHFIGGSGYAVRYLPSAKDVLTLLKKRYTSKKESVDAIFMQRCRRELDVLKRAALSDVRYVVIADVSPGRPREIIVCVYGVGMTFCKEAGSDFAQIVLRSTSIMYGEPDKVEWVGVWDELKKVWSD